MIKNGFRKARKAALLLGRPVYRRGIRFGVAAAIEHRAVLASLGFCTVVDVGANRGQFALVCRDLAPQATIYSFEPLPSACDVLQRVFDGDSLTQIYRSAIGTADGTATMHVSGREDSSSMLPIGLAQERQFPGTAETHTEEVRVAPLSSLLARERIAAPALLKIDVQGYELAVLAGCDSLLAAFAFVYVECSFVELYDGQALATDVVDFLSARGFALAGVYNLTYNRVGAAVQGDFLFSRRS